MDQVDVILKEFSKYYGIFNGQAAFDEFRCADTELDKKIIAAFFSYPVADFDSKTGAVLVRTAVTVSPLVGEGGEKTVDQPAVSTVYHAHFKAALFGIKSRVGKIFH